MNIGAKRQLVLERRAAYTNAIGNEPNCFGGKLGTRTAGHTSSTTWLRGFAHERSFHLWASGVIGRADPGRHIRWQCDRDGDVCANTSTDGAGGTSHRWRSVRGRRARRRRRGRDSSFQAFGGGVEWKTGRGAEPATLTKSRDHRGPQVRAVGSAPLPRWSLDRRGRPRQSSTSGDNRRTSCFPIQTSSGAPGVPLLALAARSGSAVVG